MRPLTAAAVLTPFLIAPGLASAQSPSPELDREEAVRSALSAAPRSVTEDATILDQTMPPSGQDGEP